MKAGNEWALQDSAEAPWRGDHFKPQAVFFTVLAQAPVLVAPSCPLSDADEWRCRGRSTRKPAP